MNKLGLIKLGNSPLGLHSADLVNFGRSQTISLVSRPKFTKSYESQIENPSVVVALPRIYESKRESIIFRHCEANRRIAEAIQNKNNPCDSTPNLARFIDSALDSQSIRATNRNGRNCGGGFVFVRIFGIETRLGVCEIPKILTSAKDAPKSELNAQDEFVRLWV